MKDDLTATENLSIACTLAGRTASPQQAGEALESYGLAADGVAVRRLSQGQRRRAALARLLLSADAPLWLLDGFGPRKLAGLLVSGEPAS